eukprot:m.13945 g.13945  ORF g.13945 m.13945 type:complete len:304 (-) comp9928_c1_seq1:154-1065(-)
MPMPSDKVATSAVKKPVTWQEAVIAGGIAGAVSRTVIAPIERVKILYQVNVGPSSIRSLVTDVVQKEGIAKLWRGNSAAVVRVVPYLSLQFLSMEKYKQALDDHTSLSKNWRVLLSGSCAGVTAVALTYPLDVVRARMALQNEGLAKTNYKNMFDALRVVTKEEGAIALYRGIAATTMGAAPYTGLKFFFYESLKTSYEKAFGVDECPQMVRLPAGASAGLLALCTVYPFDVVRRRMQTHKGGAKYPSVWNALTTIARTEGIKSGLYRGLSLNFVKTVPNVAIYLSLYDYVKQWLSTRETALR